MTERGQESRKAIGRINAIAGLMVFLLCLGVIVGLALDVQRRLEALGRAQSDSVQWALAQIEVETSLLHESLSKDRVDLAEVRKRFDVFFSRMQIFLSGNLYSGLREIPEFGRSLAAVEDFIEECLPVLDGPDDDLRKSLQRIEEKSAEMRQHARSMSLTGIEYFSQLADVQRRDMARTLQSTAGLTALLIVALTVLTTVLLRLNQRSRVQAEDNRLTTARLETIVGTSVDAIVVVARDGRVLEFNPAAEKMLGYARNEVLGKDVSDLFFAPETAAETVSLIESYLTGGTEAPPSGGRVEIDVLRKDRTTFPIELSVASADSTTGEIVVAFLRDISDRRRAEQDLIEARDQALEGEKAKADFIAVMSHEIRTPLNGLLGSVEILEATGLDPQQREILGVIETSGQVLLHHVNSVLDMTSAEASAAVAEPVGFSLEALVGEVVANQAGLATAAGNTLETVVVTGPAGTVIGDPARLRQILLNLVGNAVKFTQNGQITIEIDAEAPVGGMQQIEFRVIDTGIGVAESDQHRVFEDFVTLDRSYGREAGGTGLGLGITRRLVQSLGGKIGMESELGQGSVFWVRLPFGVAAAEMKTTQRAEKVATEKSVLVIEDNAINRFVLRTLLEDKGFRVAEAVDGIEGVAIAEATRYGLILMDISMPRLDGIEAARRIRAGNGLSSAARIIAVTAHALPGELEQFRAAGMDDCLVKPVTRLALNRVAAGGWAAAEPRREAHASLPVLDRAQLFELLSRLDASVGNELLRRFLIEGDRTIPRLLSCPPDPDASKLGHRLAGSAATFGAKRLGASLVAAEWVAAHPPNEMATRRVQGDIEWLWSQTKAELVAIFPALAA